MSYLDELEDIMEATVYGMSEDDAPALSKEFYTALLERLLRQVFWVFYDRYNSPTKILAEAPKHSDVETICRVDLLMEPTLTIKSSALNRLATETAIQLKAGPIEYSDMLADLSVRRIRKIMLAGLRPFTRQLKETFGRDAIIGMSEQSRMLIIRLDLMVSRIKLDREEIYPVVVRRYLDAREEHYKGQSGESDSRMDGA